MHKILNLFNIIVLFIVISLSSFATADVLKPFTSDGCSAFPDGTMEQNTLWLTCCQQHDFDYWKGGTYQQRLDSDNALRSCVSNVGEREVALLMLGGVRVGGSPFFPTKFRWGYGWPYPRFYKQLTESEQKQVEALTPLK